MAKIIKNNSGNFVVIFVIFSLVTGWFFSGWPPLLEFRIKNIEHRVPPKIQIAQALTAGPNYAGAAGTNAYTLPANAVGSVETSCAGDNYGTAIVTGFWNTFGFAILFRLLLLLDNVFEKLWELNHEL
mgnify:CR=1 FL=1